MSQHVGCLRQQGWVDGLLVAVLTFEAVDSSVVDEDADGDKDNKLQGIEAHIYLNLLHFFRWNLRSVLVSIVQDNKHVV